MLMETCRSTLAEPRWRQGLGGHGEGREEEVWSKGQAWQGGEWEGRLGLVMDSIPYLGSVGQSQAAQICATSK